MTIYFDMDGTIADLYGVENWLEYLINSNSLPYEIAKPLVNLSLLARRLNRLRREGYKLGIISWLSKENHPDYNKAVTAAKEKWLKKHLPSIKWDEISIVSYGTPKSSVASEIGILFDDEEANRKEWKKAGGTAFAPDEIFNILKVLNDV